MLVPRWLDHIPMGGTSGIVALRRAARAVQSGDANVVACLAGDTNHVDSFRRSLESFSQFARDATYPYGAGGPNMVFALITAHYMRVAGAKPEDFGKLCVAQRENARQFPHALLQSPLTLGQYLGARMIADPLRLFDCVMPCAGAEAFLVMRADLARRHGRKFARVLVTIDAVKTSAVNMDQSKLVVDPPTSTWAPGSDVKVCAHYPYSINIIAAVVSAGNLDSCTTERVE